MERTRCTMTAHLRWVRKTAREVQLLVQLAPLHSHRRLRVHLGLVRGSLQTPPATGLSPETDQVPRTTTIQSCDGSKLKVETFNMEWIFGGVVLPAMLMATH